MIKTNRAIAAELIASLLDGEGTTVDRYNESAPTTGYVVGVTGIKDPEGYDAVERWVASFDHTQYYYGSWRDSETGSVFYDVVEIFDDLQEALLTAHGRNEIAIWDLANAREIRVEY